MRFWFSTFDLLAIFGLGSIFAALFLLEKARPLRRRVASWWRRLRVNLLVAAPTFLVLRLLLIPAVVAVAAFGERHGVGLLRWLAVPEPCAAVVAMLLLDYAMYGWHWANHRVPWLWRFHNVHHTDLDLDVTTAVRFHFGEMLLSVGVRSAQVLLLGASPLAALAYELVLEASTQFHHSNLRLPPRVERVLSWFIMTPRAHGIHHSIEDRETNSNYSNFLLWWDRLHGTTCLNVRQDAVVIGVPTHRDERELSARALLLMPFRRQRRARPDPAAPAPADPARTTGEPEGPLAP